MNPVLPDLFDGDVTQVGDAVGHVVVVRIEHLVEELLLDGPLVDDAAGIRCLGDDGFGNLVDFGDGKADLPSIHRLAPLV